MLPTTNNYWSNGPHYQYNGAIIFITWRLAFTLLQHILRMFKEMKMNPYDKRTLWTKTQLKEYETRLFKLFVEYDTALASIRHADIS